MADSRSQCDSECALAIYEDIAQKFRSSDRVKFTRFILNAHCRTRTAVTARKHRFKKKIPVYNK